MKTKKSLDFLFDFFRPSSSISFSFSFVSVCARVLSPSLSFAVSLSPKNSALEIKRHNKKGGTRRFFPSSPVRQTRNRHVRVTLLEPLEKLLLACAPLLPLPRI